MALQFGEPRPSAPPPRLQKDRSLLLLPTPPEAGNRGHQKLRAESPSVSPFTYMNNVLLAHKSLRWQALERIVLVTCDHVP